MFIIFDSNPRFPPFYYTLGAILGLLFYGDVSVMNFNAFYLQRGNAFIQYLFKRFCKIVKWRIFFGFVWGNPFYCPLPDDCWDLK